MTKVGCLIGSAFARLDQKKQTRILDAALAEFAQYGFEHASTNRIVASAGIGKGMLFHYFNSKRDLYYHLIEYAITFIMERYVAELDTSETDFIKRYERAAQSKFAIMAKHPRVFHFMTRVHLEDSAFLPVDLQKRLEDAQHAGFAKLFENVDTKLFRRDVSPQHIFKIIHWVMEGYQKHLTDRLKAEKDIPLVDYDNYWTEFYEWMAVLRQILYHPQSGSPSCSVSTNGEDR